MRLEKSKCPPEALVYLEPDQIEKLKPFVEKWKTGGDFTVIGALDENDGAYIIGLRQFPSEVSNQLIKIVNDFYEGESNASS